MRLHSIGSLGSVAATLLVLGLSACGPSSSGGDDDDDSTVDGGSTGDPCDPGEARCSGLSFQECVDGYFAESEHCSSACSVEYGGCIECVPGENTCNGDAVYTCTDDGSYGTLVETCGDGTSCDNGECRSSSDCGEAGSELIYVVDDSNRLLSFDPSSGNTFTLVGTLDCSAGAPITPPPPPPLPAGPATPFSMSVARDGTAWVLYSSGEIFHVSTEDASCQASGFQINQSNGDGGLWGLFGMGFVSNSAGSDEETLFLAGGEVDPTIPGHLGTLDTTSLAITTVDNMQGGSEYSPELTGTGDAELYGYYPGASNTLIL